MDCIDDRDISIRLKALELGAGMVTSENLVTVVERLLQQLHDTPTSTGTADKSQDHVLNVEPAANSDDEDPEESLHNTADRRVDSPALHSEYSLTLIRQIIKICSRDTYANIVDFEWYLEVLLRLIRLVSSSPPKSQDQQLQFSWAEDIASVIGWELRNVAVRVSTVRTDAVMAAYSLMNIYASDNSLTPSVTGGGGVMTSVVWLVGEYHSCVGASHITLDPFIHPRVHLLPSVAICAYLQAIPKVLSAMVSPQLDWNLERQTMMSLLAARVIHFLDPLTTNPNIEVQERSVEILELMRVIFQAISSHGLDNVSGPLLLTTVMPQLFTGFDLNPVAPTAQRKVPLPAALDLEKSVHGDLSTLLRRADQISCHRSEAAEIESFYHQPPSRKATNTTAIDALTCLGSEPSSYQQTEDDLQEYDSLSRKRVQRRERNKEDPFYIGNENVPSRTSTPFHSILTNINGEDVDVDSIPIMDLDLGDEGPIADSSGMDIRRPRRKRPKEVHVAQDETIEIEDLRMDEGETQPTVPVEHTSLRQQTSQRYLLQVDSSGLGALSFGGDTGSPDLIEVKRQEAQDIEMAKALAEVERLRLEMQRASERIEATDGTPAEGTLVKVKKKKKKKPLGEEITGKEEEQGRQDSEAVPIAKRKRKKKKAGLPQREVG